MLASIVSTETAVTTKRCSICQEYKDRAEFNSSSYCKPCEAEYRKQYRINNKNSQIPKTCPICKETKPRSEFYASGYCKKCGGKIARDLYRIKNPNVKIREKLPPGQKRCPDCKEIFELLNMHSNTCKPCGNRRKRKRYHESKKRDPNSLKVCGYCKTEKPLKEFTNPIYAYCRECFNQLLKNKWAPNRSAKT